MESVVVYNHAFSPSLSLQVFHVPVEERKYVSHESSFGEHAADITQAGIVRDIMEKTGCTIEMSQAKDQSLTIMVTGRPSSVSEARRMIISSLQQQVSCCSGQVGLGGWNYCEERIWMKLGELIEKASGAGDKEYVVTI